jgi:hypothetical protein
MSQSKNHKVVITLTRTDGAKPWNVSVSASVLFGHTRATVKGQMDAIGKSNIGRLASDLVTDCEQLYLQPREDEVSHGG